MKFQNIFCVNVLFFCSANCNKVRGSMVVFDNFKIAVNSNFLNLIKNRENFDS